MQVGGEHTPTELAGYQLQAGADAQRGQAQQWRHDLALWAERRTEDALPLARCVVTLNAPELFDAALLGVEEFASKAEMTASTLRAYIARDEADIPIPQAIDGPRKRWAKPVVDDWLEERLRDPGHVGALLNDPRGDDEDGEDSLAPGLRRLWNRLTTCSPPSCGATLPPGGAGHGPTATNTQCATFPTGWAGSRRCTWIPPSRSMQ